MNHRALLPTSAQDQLDDADYALSAVRGLSELLCGHDAMECVQPDNLNALISIVADRLEAALAI